MRDACRSARLAFRTAPAVRNIERRTMKKIALAAALFALLVAPLCAFAQAKAPPPAQAQAQAAPTQKAAPPAAPAATAVAAPTKTAAHATRRVPSTADARVCLEFQDNLQVMKCAEKYRYAS